MKRWFHRLAAITALSVFASAHAAPQLLNASYDVARDFYRDFNPAFAAYWKDKTGTAPALQQSHGGSSKQARAVIDGLDADVLTTNNPLDIDAVAKAGLIDPQWAHKFPHQASPSWRSEEHTSELQSLMRISYAVFCLKKKNNKA